VEQELFNLSSPSVTLVEQELPTLNSPSVTLVEQGLSNLSSPTATLVEQGLSTLSSPSVLGSIGVAHSLVFRSVFVNNCLPFQLVIVYCLSFDFRLLVDPSIFDSTQSN
jgi:hypothetical protein